MKTYNKYLILIFAILATINVQSQTSDLLDKDDLVIGKYIGYEYNNIKKILGEPYESFVLDTIKITRTHLYELTNEQDTIQFQLYYDKDLFCNMKTFILNKEKHYNKLQSTLSRYLKVDDMYITPNRYIVTYSNFREDEILLAFNTTIYPIILAQLDQIQYHLKQASTKYSEYDLQSALNLIEKLNQSILTGTTINNITKSELKILTKIYNGYLHIANYNGVKISFIQYNKEIYFELIPNEIDKLKHKSIDTVNFSEIQNLTQF